MTKEDTWKAIDEERARQKADQVSQQPAALNQRVLTDEEVALLSCDEGTLEFNIYKYGHKVAYQDWDSGGPGGAGTVSVYKYKKSYYVLHEAGLSGPYRTKEKAIKVNGVATGNAATEEIWDEDLGFVFLRK